jgi:hypothetical protein
VSRMLAIRPRDAVDIGEMDFLGPIDYVRA